MGPSSRPRNRNAFEVVIICALRIESDAVEALFDEAWNAIDFGKAPGDLNAYVVGRIGSHNVVLAFMPAIGKSSAASVASSLRSSFPKVRLGLVVGVCGAIPLKDKKEIILGDVIISTGVVQYDLVRQFPNKTVRKDTLEDNLGRPNPEIRAFLAMLQGLHIRKQLRTDHSSYLVQLSHMEELDHAKYPGSQRDKLFDPGYRHKHQDAADCQICAECKTDQDEVCQEVLSMKCKVAKCSEDKMISRKRLAGNKLQSTSDVVIAIEQATPNQNPEIHFGRIASGDLIMKSGRHRDKIAEDEDVIAFEMEGSGVWDQFPTILIKGVCDYADSHKNKDWQAYAAASAAACTKALLRAWYANAKGEIMDDDQKNTRVSPSGENSVPSQTNVFKGNMYSQGGPQFLGGNITGNTFNFGASQGL